MMATRSKEVTPIYDLHSHWATRRGDSHAPRTEAERARHKESGQQEPHYLSEDGMAAHFRKETVRVILDFSFDKYLSVPDAAEVHDYGFETQRKHPDVILGNWVQINPRTGAEGVQELRRCRDVASGFLGFAVSGSGAGPASDSVWDPYYKLCIEAKIPVLIMVGTTDIGADQPGGGGVLVENCHPRYLDQVAARYPELCIVAARPGWPWEAETIAVLLHKRNIWYEVHGRSPKHFTADLRYEIPRRLKDRVMFGADYPMNSYEHLIRDWREEAYSNDVLDHVFTKNAERFFASVST